MRITKAIGSLLIFLVTSCTTNTEKPKNIILMIGDGMGPAHVKALRLYRDDPNTPFVESLSLDAHFVGTLATDPAHESGVVTDSAASATAYATGIKTFNGGIALDPDKNPALTVLELAKQKGLRTGLVATSQIVHATPAAFIAHVESRREYNKIADFFVDNQINGEPVIDLFLGGGWQYFRRDDRNLIDELQNKGFDVVRTKEELSKAGDRVAGLFADVSIPPVLDREPHHPTLAQMTQAALERLKNKNGFFLMIEGSQIDWASHDNNVAEMIHEMDDFEKAFLVARSFAESNGDTLLLVTADHETGGFSVGASYNDDDIYQFDVSLIKRMTKSLKSYSEMIHDDDSLELFLQEMSLELTEKEQIRWKKLGDKKTPKEVYKFLKKLVNRASIAGWTTGGHTGVDVNLYAVGAGAEMFKGHHSNVYIGQSIKKWLKGD